jgi:hypothetical protein
MQETSRNSPRISINKLGEYITAKPARRKKIIHDQKYPSSFIVPYYTDATNLIMEYLTTREQGEDVFNQKIQDLTKKATSSEWEQTKKSLCIEAWDSFMEFAEELEFGGLKCSRAPFNPPKMIIHDVEISVRPELFLADSKDTIQGCIKLVFGKTKDIDEEATQYIGVCLQRYVSEQHNVSNHKTCFVLDIFDKKIYTAPKAYKRRIADVEVACEEIQRAWMQL